MLETSARLLRLLALLQTRPDWTGAELAERLQVSPRTVRYDVEKLRNLGYPVHAAPGSAGGYRLGAGAALPPLLLDDDEAVAVAVGLRSAAGGGVAGIEETSVRALVKLEQVLPERLRARVDALHTYTVAVQPDGPKVDAATLTAIATSCRDRHRLRFDYRSHDGTATVRDVEPHSIVHTGRRWYLVAWDVHRDAWRTFRLDRIALRTPAGPRFTPRQAPSAEIVTRGVQTVLARYRARVLVRAPAADIAACVPASVLVETVDEDTCVVHASGDTPLQLAMHVLMLDADVEVDGPPELIETLRRLAARCAGAVRPRTGRGGARSTPRPPRAPRPAG